MKFQPEFRRADGAFAGFASSLAFSVSSRTPQGAVPPEFEDNIINCRGNGDVALPIRFGIFGQCSSVVIVAWCKDSSQGYVALIVLV